MTPNSVEHIGELLQRERVRREISLQSISHATKISLRNLERLEAGDFAELPAPVFVRGFVKAYSKAVGFDQAAALAELDRCVAERAKSLELPEPPPQPAGDRAIPLHPKARGVALLVLVIVLIVVAARWLSP